MQRHPREPGGPPRGALFVATKQRKSLFEARHQPTSVAAGRTRRRHPLPLHPGRLEAQLDLRFHHGQLIVHPVTVSNICSSDKCSNSCAGVGYVSDVDDSAPGLNFTVRRSAGGVETWSATRLPYPPYPVAWLRELRDEVRQAVASMEFSEEQILDAVYAAQAPSSATLKTCCCSTSARPSCGTCWRSGCGSSEAGNRRRRQYRSETVAGCITSAIRLATPVPNPRTGILARCWRTSTRSTWQA